MKSPVYFASAEDLIVLKLIANRPKDLEDVEGVIELNKDNLDKNYLAEKGKEWGIWDKLKELLKG